MLLELCRNQNKYQLILVDESNIVFDMKLIEYSLVGCREYIVILISLANFIKYYLPNDVIEGLELSDFSHPTIIQYLGWPDASDEKLL